MNLKWFTGVVEDIADPCQMGRVRVRCFGIHVPKTNDFFGTNQAFDNPDGMPDLDTPHLLWAPCILPITDPNVGGISGMPPGLLPGSIVLGFFRDGDDMQDPVVLGCYSHAKGYDIEYQKTFGFGDPNGMFSYSSFNNDFPEDSNTFTSVNGHGSRISQFISNFLGGGSLAPAAHYSGFEKTIADEAKIELNGSIQDIVNVAKSQAGNVIESGGRSNRGASIAKFWDAVGWSGESTAQPWCAAFASWCIKTSGIIPEEHVEQHMTADSTALISSFRRKPYARVIYRPRQILPGDIIKFNWRHVGIAIEPSANGRVKVVEGNTSHPGGKGIEGCFQKYRSLTGAWGVHSIARINIKQTPPLEPLKPVGSGGLNEKDLITNVQLKNQPGSYNAPLPPAHFNIS